MGKLGSVAVPIWFDISVSCVGGRRAGKCECVCVCVCVYIRYTVNGGGMQISQNVMSLTRCFAAAWR